MTREEWKSLKVGDVVRWKRPDGTYILRTVMATGWNGSVTFPIRRKSWTRRMHTSYIFSDIGTKVELHGAREDRLMTDSELLNLCDVGFDIPAALRREVDRYGCFRDADDSMRTKMSGAATVARKFCPVAPQET